uniref:Nodule cysteine-rich protein 9 n=1 Tax=Cicer arietinum TaxID=3827 RepID=A0A0U8TY14_CICAR|nr:TPA_exp: nodule cysteine-rich protein 9 [Cicer arietinum]
MVKILKFVYAAILFLVVTHVGCSGESCESASDCPSLWYKCIDHICIWLPISTRQK